MALTIAQFGCSGGASTSPPVTTLSSPPPPLLVVGDGFDALFGYRLGTVQPTFAQKLAVPNATYLAGGRGTVAALGGGAINVVFAQSFLGGATYGARIPYGRSGVSDTSGIALDPSGNVYATNVFGYAIFAGVQGTTQPFASVRVIPQQELGLVSFGGLAVDPKGDVAVGEVYHNFSETLTWLSEFSPLSRGARQLGTFAGIAGSLPFAFDDAGRLFIGNGETLVALALTFPSGVQTLASTNFPLGPASVAVDSNDNAFVLSGLPSKERILAYHFGASGLQPLWSIAAPPGAQTLAVSR
ncbi:MAG: hypothetical protein JO060_03410 [Candidatus Eremiobacteraeota bacterium]|nr:hypothetical protein [Candidatus Eremiobacteraeota bacterium]